MDSEPPPPESGDTTRRGHGKRYIVELGSKLRFDGESGQDDQCYLDVFLGIPMVYLGGVAVWWLAEIQILLTVAGASLLAWGVIAKALFLTPPTE